MAASTRSVLASRPRTLVARTHGAPWCAFGEPARLPGVNLGEGNAAGAERRFELPVIRAGGLEHDQGRVGLSDPSDKRLVTSLVIRNLDVPPVRQPMGIQLNFRNVDADG